MIDIEATRERTRRGTPPISLPHDEIEILRKSTSPELLALLKKFLDAKRVEQEAVDEMARLARG